jgi:glycosyltransferase involved in cell wall biosynthesis
MREPLPGITPPQPLEGVIAVIPAFNEERFIASVVHKARWSAERVIVVDDGSSDLTGLLAEAAGAEVIYLESNQGKAKALSAGFRRALSYAPKAVVMLDGDAQHEPSEIPSLVGPILEGRVDVVVGSRFLKSNPIPFWRRIGQWGLNLATNHTSGLRLTDTQSGFRAFSPTALQQLHFESPGLSLESEMQFHLKAAGLKVLEVPIGVRYDDPPKRNPFAQGFRILETIVGLVTRKHPLLILTLPGALLTLLGVYFGVEVLIRFHHTGALLIGSAFLSVLLGFSGLLLGISGAILHSLQTLSSLLQAELRKELSRLPTKSNQHEP